MIAVILAREGKQNRRRFEEAEKKYEKALAEKVAPGPVGALHGLDRRSRSWSPSASSSSGRA